MTFLCRTVLVLVLGAAFVFAPAFSLLANGQIPTSPDEMARRIDQLLAERWQRESSEVQPAPPAEDDEFLRRGYLDLTGVTPSVAQAREFLASKDSDKRIKLIDKLTRSAGFATHMATTWRNRLLPDNFDPAQLQNAAGLQNWLRDQFVENLRYDNLVAEFLVAKGGGDRGPGIFYTAHEIKPEKLAASSARVFLGLQIQCAQCHDHPTDRWTQKDFWGFAAFFAQLQQPENTAFGANNQIEDLPGGEVTLPDTEEVISPKYPAGQNPGADERGTRRRQLAIWMASRDNPFLPRAAANWAWAHMFGRGIVDPVDDLSENNPPSHPELLDELSLYFANQGFDLQLLLKTIALTDAYQRSSRGGNETATTPSLFAQMALKTLTPEQLFDSLAQCLVKRPQTLGMGQRRGQLFDQRRQQFITRMQSQSRNATEYDTGLPQALMMMNGPLVGEATHIEQSGLLTSLEAPFFKNSQRLEVLMLATLSRLPSDAERTKLEAYLAAGEKQGETRRALGDLLWAFLNSAEFALNH